MVTFKLDLVARAGELLPDDAGIPEWFVPAIRSRWLSSKDTILLAILTEPRTGPHWVALGEYLTGALISTGRYVGMTVDGNPHVERAIRWIEVIAKSNDPGILEFALRSSMHPIKHTVIGVDINWNSIQPSSASNWLQYVWTDTPSNLFHVGCDLLIASYDVVSPAFAETITPRPSPVLASLDRATAWLIPIDENIGFFMGVREASPLYEEITSRASVND